MRGGCCTRGRGEKGIMGFLGSCEGHVENFHIEVGSVGKLMLACRTLGAANRILMNRLCYSHIAKNKAAPPVPEKKSDVHEHRHRLCGKMRKFRCARALGCDLHCPMFCLWWQP